MKLKNHFASLTSKKSKIRETYVIPSFKISASERKRLSKEEINRKEQEFAAHHGLQKVLKEEAAVILESIEHTEILDTSTKDVMGEKELRNELKRKGEERKQARQQKIQKSMELAEKDLKIKSELQELILQVKKAIGALAKKDAVIDRFFLSKLGFFEDDHLLKSMQELDQIFDSMISTPAPQNTTAQTPALQNTTAQIPASQTSTRIT